MALASVDPSPIATMAQEPCPADASALGIDPGQWLASVHFHWQTGCFAGDGYVDVLLETS